MKNDLRKNNEFLAGQEVWNFLELMEQVENRLTNLEERLILLSEHLGLVVEIEEDEEVEE
jgi:hypothetical protein